MFIYTKEELTQLHKDRVQELSKVAGSPSHLAKMLDMPFSTVQAWIARGRISKAGASAVEKHPSLGEKFTREYLRPELTNTK